MKNLAFVIWMIGFPLSMAVEKYFFYVSRKETASDGAKAFNGLFELITWAVIGYLIFEK